MNQSFCVIFKTFSTSYFSHRAAYKGYAGGVLAIRRFQFEHINGFSNEFFGWGGEDDDLYNRLRFKQYDVDRDLSRGGFFFSLDHNQAEPNPERYLQISCILLDKYKYLLDPSGTILSGNTSQI